MKVIDAYSQYFAAKAFINDLQRNAALVFLQAVSEEGSITYTVNVNFWPYRDETDWAVSYDAVYTREIYRAKGRRSRKREREILEGDFRRIVGELAAEVNGQVFWDKPLREARYD